MAKTMEPVDIIIPTYNNPDMLSQCLSSIGGSRLSYPINCLIVNNGHPSSLDQLGSEHWFRVIQTGGMNLGWEGGLKKGLEQSKSEHVMFMNDDTYIVDSEMHWIRKMMETFSNLNVGAVGPISNVVRGCQNMLYRTPNLALQATYLIGFCMLLKRKALDQVGGIDDTLPGGDDFDLSIRLRKAGYDLVIRRDVFVYHHGFVTGRKMHGDETRRGGWNSPEMTEKVNMALIRKHGFAEWFKCVAGYEYPGLKKGDDHEGNVIRQHIYGEKILDLGCANNKTVPHATGVDIIPRGKDIPFLNAKSEGDIVADVEHKLPFGNESHDTIIARHILEHCIDPVEVIKEWARVMKKEGRMIIAVPNEDLMRTIPLNGEHVHAFTPDSLKNLSKLIGLKRTYVEGTTSGSFVSVFQKNGYEHS